MRPKAEAGPAWVRAEPEHTDWARGGWERRLLNEQQQWQAGKEPPRLTLSGPCQENCVSILF